MYITCNRVASDSERDVDVLTNNSTSQNIKISAVLFIGIPIFSIATAVSITRSIKVLALSVCWGVRGTLDYTWHIHGQV